MGYHNKRLARRNRKKRQDISPLKAFSMGLNASLFPDYYKTRGAMANLGIDTSNPRFLSGYTVGYYARPLLTAALLLGGGFLGGKIINKKLDSIYKTLKELK